MGSNSQEHNAGAVTAIHPKERQLGGKGQLAPPAVLCSQLVITHSELPVFRIDYTKPHQGKCVLYGAEPSQCASAKHYGIIKLPLILIIPF